MNRSRRNREKDKPESARQPLGTIDAILAKHPGDWKACADELKDIRAAIMKRGDEILTRMRSDIDKIDAQIALLERLPAK